MPSFSDDSPATLIITKSDHLNCDFVDPNLINDMFEYMSSGDADTSDALIVSNASSQVTLSRAIPFSFQISFIEGLRRKFSKHFISNENQSFENSYILSQFRLNEESTEKILRCIALFSAPLAEDSPAEKVFLKSRSLIYEISGPFFFAKLRQLIEEHFQKIENFDSVDDVFMYDRMVSLCERSPIAFRSFCDATVNLMVSENFPSKLQLFLSRFVSDVKLRKNSLEEFYKLYDESLYIYVKLVNEFDGRNDEEERGIITDLLKYLKEVEYKSFVIIVTHFSDFNFLLKENML